MARRSTLPKVSLQFRTKTARDDSSGGPSWAPEDSLLRPRAGQVLEFRVALRTGDEPLLAAESVSTLATLVEVFPLLTGSRIGWAWHLGTGSGRSELTVMITQTTSAGSWAGYRRRRKSRDSNPSLRNRAVMDADRRITSLSAVPEDTTFLFTVRNDEGDRKEAILVELAAGVVGWLNYCQHFRHIKLDKGSGAEMRNGEIICTNHGAYFEEDSGVCTHGPCEGAVLESVDVTVDDGDVYLTDDDFEFVDTGPMESDDLDLASKSNIEF